MRHLLVRKHRGLLTALAVAAAAALAGACTDAPTSPEPRARQELLTAIPSVTTETCQNGGVYPECSSSDDNTNGDPTPVVPASGGSTSSDPSAPQDTTRKDTTTQVPCNTGKVLLDDPNTQAAFDSMWQKSGYPSSMDERREHGGWIIRNDDGTYAV
jgi:hypothetical protein